MIKIVLISAFVALSLALAQKPHKAANIEYLSYGYNIYYGDPLPSSTSIDPGFSNTVFNLTYLQHQTTPDGKFLEPDMITIVPEASCVLNSAATAITSSSTYINSLDVFASVDIGCPFGGFTASASYKTITQNTDQDSDYFTLSTGQCAVYMAKTNSLNLPQLDSQFIQDAINYLEISDSDSHYEFLTGYGTHYVQSITMGSRLSVMNKLSVSSWESLESEGISITAAAQASFMGLYAGYSVSVSTNKTQIQDYQSSSSNFQMTSIGSLPVGNSSIIQWARQADTNPMPIQYNLAPLSDIFNSSNPINGIEGSTLSKIQAHLDAALNGGYCNYLFSQGIVAACSGPGGDTSDSVVDGSSLETSVATGSCVLCASGCGGIYSQSQGIFDFVLVQPTWFMEYNADCSDTTSLGENTYTNGVDMCCMPEVGGQVTGTCKMCTQCGGQFTYQTGSIWDGVPNNDGWLQVYDSDCEGNLQGNSDAGDAGYDLCCDKPDVCAFCSYCGGTYPYETGIIANNDTTQNDFGYYGPGCLGSLGWEGIPGESGMKLCCANLQ